MAAIFLVIGITMAFFGALIALIARRNRCKRAAAIPSPQDRAGFSGLSADRPRTGNGGDVNVFPLPPRRTPRRTRASRAPRPPRASSEAGTFAQAAEALGVGPRGLRPAQFPCCPYDKLRNIPGGCQVIFWERESNCYRCSRGHRFKRNGRLF